METPLRRVVVVDDDSADSHLARELLERGVECLHLRSRERPANFDAQSHAKVYDAELGYIGDVKAAAGVLRPLELDAVVAASPGAAEFSGQLAAELGLPNIFGGAWLMFSSPDKQAS